MRLAMMTSIPSVVASKKDDSPDNIKKFEEAMKELKKEFFIRRTFMTTNSTG